MSTTPAPAQVMFVLGMDEHGRTLKLTGNVQTNGQTLWTIKREAYNQRDTSPVIDGIPAVLIHQAARCIDVFERAK